MPSRNQFDDMMRARLSRRRAMKLGAAAGIAPLATGAAATSAHAQDESTPEAAAATEGGLLPDNRLLLYYGFPGNELMGILGEYEPEALLEVLQEQAAGYEAADPDTPIQLGLELIASVAQDSPGEDGLYIANTGDELLDQYTEFTAANDMILMFDIQMGHRDPMEDYSRLEPWLREPHTHLGIDPEFRMGEGQVPGLHLGQISGPEVTEAQHWLADLAADAGVPPKILLVHQFDHGMFTQKEEIAPVDGVQLVIHEDGWGTPEQKQDTYREVITNEPIEYHGFKIFYQLDEPLMMPEDVLALDPTPHVITYQ